MSIENPAPTDQRHHPSDVKFRKYQPKRWRNDNRSKGDRGGRDHDTISAMERLSKAAMKQDIQSAMLAEPDADADTGEGFLSEPQHSGNFEELGDEVSDTIRYHGRAYGPSYQSILDEQEQKNQPHPLDIPDNREAWTYGDPAQVAARLNVHSHTRYQ